MKKETVGDGLMLIVAGGMLVIADTPNNDAVVIRESMLQEFLDMVYLMTGYYTDPDSLDGNN